MKEKIRIPKNTLEKISKTYKIVNPFQAIASYVNLVENYFLTEKGIPSKYNSETGKPEEWSWKPYEKFQQKNNRGFLFNNEAYAWLTDGVGKKLKIVNQKVITTIQETIKKDGLLLIDLDSKQYVAYLDSIGWSNHEGDYGNVKSGIVVLPITKELKLEGLVELAHLKK